MQFISLLVVSLGLALCSQSIFAEESDKEKIKLLEQRLEQSEQLLKKLSQQLTELKNKVENTPALEEQDERITELEDSVEEIDEKVGSRAVVHGFDGLKVDVGGFIHSALTIIDGENSSEASFNRQNFELLIKADLNEDWSAFFAGGFLRESDDPFILGSRTSPSFNSVSKSPQIIAWTNYRYNDALNVRMGRFITPHGIINQEHFPAILLDPEQPQFLRPFGGDTLFPNFSTGLQLHGKRFVGKDGANKLDYNIYASNFAGLSNETIFGGRAGLTFGDSGIAVGGNLASGSRVRQGLINDYDLWGIDFLIDKGRLLWKTEIFATDEDAGKDRLGFYTQPALRLNNQWLVFYRYDELDNGGDTVGDSIENMLGFNYTPSSNIRLRATFTHKTMESGFDRAAIFFPEVDADIVQFSGTFSF